MPDKQPTVPTQPSDPARSSPPGLWVAPAVEELQARLPQYEVIELLGRGGMGAVYRARQKSLRRLVAIKILARESVQDDLKFAERFQHEAMAMARLSHPGIVNVHDAGEAADGLLYFVMEHVEGRDLAHEIAERGRLPEAEARAMAMQIVEALGYAHANGIVHRDIKPANILLDAQGRVKVADFGLAKASEPLVSTLLTKSGTSMGTADFMAPETRKSGMADARSDLFSLGVTLYQMLTGELPQGMFKLPSELHPELDARWDEIICKALEPRPQDRYQSTEELKRDLAEIDADKPRATKISSTPKRRWRLAAAWVGVALVAGMAWPFLRPQATVEQRRDFDLEAFRQQMAAADVETQWGLLKTKIDELNGSDVTILRKDEDKQRGRITYLGINHKSRQIKDIRPIAAISGYFELAFHDLWLEDISCLKGMRIGRLGIFQSNFTDLSVLSTLPSLTALNLANARGIKDFTPLGRLKLQVLDLNTNPQLKDIAFVRGMPLTHLNILGTSVKDLSPLAGMELKGLECDNDVPISAELLRSLPKLELINRKPVNASQTPTNGEAQLSRVGEKPSPGQWIKLFNSVEEMPSDLRKPDSGVMFQNGWFVPDPARMFYLHIGKAGVSSNVAIRLRFRPRNDAGEEQNLSELRLRAGKRGSYCFNATATKGYVMRLVRDAGGKEHRDVLASATLTAKALTTPTPQITFGVVGSKLIARSEDELLMVVDDGSYQSGEMEFMNTRAAVGDIEIVNLDGLSEKEALRILGVDETGKDIHASPQSAAGMTPAASPAGKVIDLMPLIDLKRNVVAGEWRLEGGRLFVSKSGEGAKGFPRLELPYAPPAEYDFEVEFEVASEGSGVAQILSAHGRSFSWVTGVKLAAGSKSGFDLIEGQTVMNRLDGTVMRPADFLPAGRRHVMKVQVRSTTLRGFLNGEQLVHWGKSAEVFQLLGISPRLALRSPERLGLAADNRAVTFQRITVREVTGEGRKTSNAIGSEQKDAPWRDWLTMKLNSGDLIASGWIQEKEGITTREDIKGVNMIAYHVRDCAARLTYEMRGSKGVQISMRERKGASNSREICFVDDSGSSLHIGRMLPDRTVVKLANKDYTADASMASAPRVLEFRCVGDTLTATLKGATREEISVSAVDGVLDKGPCALVLKKGVLLRKAEVMELD